MRSPVEYDDGSRGVAAVVQRFIVHGSGWASRDRASGVRVPWKPVRGYNRSGINGISRTLVFMEGLAVMHMATSRRRLMQVAAGAGVARLAGVEASALAAQQYGSDSLGIGLMRVDFEAAYGVGTPWNDLMVYENVDMGVPGTKMYVGYLGDVVSHIELGWSLTTQAGGIDWGTANQTATSLLPIDAQHRDQYWLPATPEGPILVIGHVYESAQLNEANYGLGRVLVLYQRKDVQMNASAPLEPIITAATLTMPSPGQ